MCIRDRLSPGEWDAIPWTSDFVDIEGDKRPAPHFPVSYTHLYRNLRIPAPALRPCGTDFQSGQRTGGKDCLLYTSVTGDYLTLYHGQHGVSAAKTEQADFKECVE